jgi:hypothetical protein
VTFEVEVLSSGFVSYQWLKDCVAIPGETASILTINGVTAEDAGDYAAQCIGEGYANTSRRATLVVQYGPAPATSTWGIAALALLVLVSGTLAIERRRSIRVV